MGVIRVMYPFFKFYIPIIYDIRYIFGTGEGRHFKFRVLIDTKEYYCMHD